MQPAQRPTTPVFQEATRSIPSPPSPCMQDLLGVSRYSIGRASPTPQPSSTILTQQRACARSKHRKRPRSCVPSSISTAPLRSRAAYSTRDGPSMRVRPSPSCRLNPSLSTPMCCPSNQATARYTLHHACAICNLRACGTALFAAPSPLAASCACVEMHALG
jgi:hypothetical protein